MHIFTFSRKIWQFFLTLRVSLSHLIVVTPYRKGGDMKKASMSAREQRGQNFLIFCAGKRAVGGPPPPSLHTTHAKWSEWPLHTIPTCYILDGGGDTLNLPLFLSPAGKGEMEWGLFIAARKKIWTLFFRTENWRGPWNFPFLQVEQDIARRWEQVF